MPTYAIGDIQGCFDEFLSLLDKLCFDPSKDTLWFTGDLVNRGKSSLSVLRFIKALGDCHKIVLGNHDLHLIALSYGVGKLKKQDTLQEILDADDREELIDWLRKKPLVYYDSTLHYTIAHAGIYPFWTVEKAIALSKEVEYALQNEPLTFLQALYGNTPSLWHDSLRGLPRLRCITNYLTRMRYCYADGSLDFDYKGTIKLKPKQLIPWFDVPHRLNNHMNIIFGHWASLGGEAYKPNLFALDTGCVWGNSLTAMRLSDCKKFSVPAKKIRAQ